MGGKAADLIELSSRYIDINLRKSILADIISTTNKYVESRFKFLNENMSELEKKQVSCSLIVLINHRLSLSRISIFPKASKIHMLTVWLMVVKDLSTT